MPSPDFDSLTLERFVRGDLSAADAARVRAWIAADEAHAAQVELLRAILERDKPAAFDPTGKVWAAIQAGMRTTPSHGMRAVAARRSHGQWWIAAAAVLVGVVGTLVWRSRGSEPTQAPPLRVVTTQKGQRADVYLSDGTHVILGVASTLRFPATFDTARNVFLEGEAFFDVAHDARKAFAVHTPRAVARDIGTRFSVRAFAGGLDVSIAVADGAVSLKAPTAPTDSILLTRSDVGRLHANGRLTSQHNADLTPYMGWTEGKLAFDNAPMREVVARLNVWYDADVQLGDSALADYPLTMSFGTRTLAQVLPIMAAALNARIERRGKSVILYASSDAKR
jgi:transmembrane sensor